MVRPHVVGFNQAEAQRLPQLQINTAAEDRSNSVARSQSLRRQPVVPEQGMSKQVHVVAAKHQARTDGSCRLIGDLVVVPAEVAFQSPVTVKVVCDRTAPSLRNAMQVLHRRVEGISRNGYVSTWIQPLIPDEHIRLRRLAVLSQRRQSEESRHQKQQQAAGPNPAPVSVPTK